MPKYFAYDFFYILQFGRICDSFYDNVSLVIWKRSKPIGLIYLHQIRTHWFDELNNFRISWDEKLDELLNDVRGFQLK